MEREIADDDRKLNSNHRICQAPCSTVLIRRTQAGASFFCCRRSNTCLPHWFGQKPVDADTIAEILAPDLDGLEARLMRNGYNVKLLTEMLGAKPKEVRSFLTGHLPRRYQLQ
jgi:hypothetical protein